MPEGLFYMAATVAIGGAILGNRPRTMDIGLAMFSLGLAGVLVAAIWWALAHVQITVH